MRIDDENKVVWCSEEEMSWYVSFNLSKGNHAVCDFNRIYCLANEKEAVIGLKADLNTRMKIISAIADAYDFKVKDKKYYWRKKKEHLAWFEKGNIYLSAANEPYLNPKLFAHKFTSQEARDLLKDDFDKFEKVECE